MPLLGALKFGVPPIFRIKERNARLKFRVRFAPRLLPLLALLAQELKLLLDTGALLTFGAQLLTNPVIAAGYPLRGFKFFRFLPCLGFIPAFVVDSSGIVPFIAFDEVVFDFFIGVSRSGHNHSPYC
jgi:hypothetical protein